MSPDEAKDLVNRLVSECPSLRVKGGGPKKGVGQRIYSVIKPMPLGAATAICDDLCRQAANRAGSWFVSAQVVVDRFTSALRVETQLEHKYTPLALNEFGDKCIVKKGEKYGVVRKGSPDAIQWVLYSTPMASWCLTPPLVILDQDELWSLKKVEGQERAEKLAEWKMMRAAGKLPTLGGLAAKAVLDMELEKGRARRERSA